jgi:predicted deacylase
LKSKIEIAGLKVDPGNIAKGVLEAGPYFPHVRAKIRKWAQIPITVINGAKDGPTLCVTAGVHGTEYAGIAASIELSNTIKPKELSGALIIVHVVNPIAFEERNYICPIDGVNIQGTFPGNPDGSIGYIISSRVFNEAVLKANYWIDLHGGDTHESEIGCAHFYRTGNPEIDSKSEGMSRALGFEYITVSEKGQGKGSSYRVGPEHGIPTTLCECGQGDKLLKEEYMRVYEGILNVMRYLKMLEGEYKKTEGQKIVPVTWIGVNSGGLFYTDIKPGDILEKGEVIGVVRNLKGEVLETVRAPTKGVNLLMIHNPVVEPGGKVILSWGILE